MARFRLKDNHPLVKNLEKIFELFDDLGISFSVDYNYGVLIDYKGETFSIVELDDGRKITSIPPALEYKIIIDKQSSEEKEKVKEEERKLKLGEIQLSINQSLNKLKIWDASLVAKIEQKKGLDSDEYKKSVLDNITKSSLEVSAIIKDLEEKINEEKQKLLNYSQEIEKLQNLD